MPVESDAETGFYTSLPTAGMVIPLFIDRRTALLKLFVFPLLILTQVLREYAS